ncbi:hypothetical protein [Salinigranum salinum]|uniref:hypothetical protein n=1 Tax=Salinigranum salinum TaxID=1364937 RepID=UPI00126122E9|nr:hypothetical protein [Salinigranum salinum]
MTDADPTRRAFLFAAGLGVGLLGMAGLRGSDSGAPDVSYDADALQRIVALGSPRTPRTLPVEITTAHLERHRDRARSLLSSAPEDPDIPNEAVAREYADRYERAADALARAETARTPYERMGDLRSARWFAADVSAVFAAYRDDLTREAVLARREPIREELAAFRDRWRYVGDDPVVAVVVHREIESEVGYAESMLEQAAERRGDEGSRVLRVGSAAGTIELARTAVADATYLYDRFVGGIDDADGRALGGAFDRTARVLRANVTERCPTVDASGREAGFDATSVARPLLDDAFSAVQWRCRNRLDEVREREGVASAVLAAGEADRDLRALDRAREAVERGAYDGTPSVEVVRREKLAALETVETARNATPSTLASRFAAAAAREVRWGDDELGRVVDRGAVDASDVARTVASYAWGRVRADATPASLSRVTGALEAATTVDEP